GLTAAIYGMRAALKTVLVEKGYGGGQIAISNEVENYPGFENISGFDLAQKFINHAKSYGLEMVQQEVTSVDPGLDYHEVRLGDGKVLRGYAVILAMGGSPRKLNVPGEDAYYGKGVSYCATCDGFFFRGKKVFIVGGGNTALLDAIYLHDAGVDVTVVHRRDSFRAELSLQTELREKGVPVMWNAVVREIRGDDLVRSVAFDVKGKEKALPADGIFVAIGLVPRNKLARDVGVEVDGFGYLKVSREMRTSVPFVYGAGDIIGGLQQVVTSVAEGAIAATTAYVDLRNPYWSAEAPE
ncbi:MAG: FAD-dependent oxidoreductase, partial [Thermoplasmata archaeon]|nr:FAD-dependent oxidoreductase [Thermoplasmata archaeon]